MLNIKNLSVSDRINLLIDTVIVFNDLADKWKLQFKTNMKAKIISIHIRSYDSYGICFEDLQNNKLVTEYINPLEDIPFNIEN